MEIKVLKASSKEILRQTLSNAFEDGWVVPPFEEATCTNGWHTTKVVKLPLVKTMIETFGKRHSVYLINLAKNAVEKAYPERGTHNDLRN